MKSSHLTLSILAGAVCALAFPGNSPAQNGHGDGKNSGAYSTEDAPKLTVDVFSNEVKNATAICFDDKGKLYVTETYRWRKGVEDNRDHTYWIMDDLATDTSEQRVAVYEKWKDKFEDPEYFTRYSERVITLEDSNDDGKADRLEEFASDFDEPEDGPAIGLIYGNGNTIYMTCIPHVWALEDTDGDGKADKRESLIDGFGPKNSLSGHDLHGLAWGPDGKLYFSMGDRGYNLKTKEGKQLKNTNSGAAFRCDPDGSNLEIFYYNLRNPQELAFNEYGDLFTVDNNCDQGDSARVCYLLEGGDTGWHLGTQALTTYKDFLDDGQMGQSPHWLSEGLWKLRFAGQPEWILPPVAHLTNGPSGMVFDSGTSLPERYKNHFLVCDYKGAPNVCFLYSFKVDQQGAGYAMQDAHIFHAGVPNTDVDLGYDGKVYLADFGGGWKRTDAGNIYAMYDPEGIKRPEVQETKALFADGFGELDDNRLAELLKHPDMRVRLRAQYTLAGRGESSIAALKEAARFSGNLFAQMHAIWGLGQLKAGTELLPFLHDSNDELRAQVTRTLGNIGSRDAIEDIRDLIADKSPRVRTFAAIAAGKLSDTAAIPALFNMLKANADKDAFERHAASFALSLLPLKIEAAEVAAMSRPERLGILLALRKKLDPRITLFLEDADPTLVNEAIRAINDLEIPAALPVLAEHTEEYAGDFSGSLPEEIMFRRIINANFRLGTPESAARLVRFGANSKLPVDYRVLALRAVELFPTPPTVDPTLGYYRPLKSRDKAAIRPQVEAQLVSIFEKSTGEIVAAATRAIGVYGIKLDNSLLQARIRDGRQPLEVRRTGMEQLFADENFADKQLLKTIIDGYEPEMAAEAARIWVARYPGEIVEPVEMLLAQDADISKRAAYSLLAGDTGADSAAMLVSELEKILNGTLFRTVHLDLYEAASQREDESVKAALNAVDDFLAADNRTVFDFLREGGDPAQGQNVFENQGICMKCHQGNRGGGDAGPPLGNIARLRRPEEILHSILEPNAKVVTGYGIAAITLKDGTTIAGTPMEENDTTLFMKTPTGETEEIAKSTIESRTPAVSAMPVMTGILSKKDLRDVMAYLLTLDGRPN
ncbi:MAG: HEAT repeat domain-containing protein [Verrucomicrobiae bacterium]|nr:HEAT repeat domain-containing protein [Verrucomicrobiae bacterium]